jgi:hypothetical protein
MVSLDARRALGTITKIAVALVILLAPFSAPAQTAVAPPSDVCALPVLADGESSQQTMDRQVGKALKRATREINREDFADAREFVGQLELDRLTPYELAMAEGVLYRIANAEQKYDEARRHVMRAIESCGLTDQGIADAQDALNRIDADPTGKKAPQCRVVYRYIGIGKTRTAIRSVRCEAHDAEADARLVESLCTPADTRPILTGERRSDDAGCT